MAPPRDRRETNRRRADPDERYEDDGAGGRHAARVGDRVGDGPVAVERDHGQVEDRRGAGEDVDRVPDVAPVGAERPPAVGRLEHDAERHHDGADDKVGDRQRHDEVIGDAGAQARLARHGRHHERVAGHRDDGERRQEAGDRQTAVTVDHVRRRRCLVVRPVTRRRCRRRRSAAVAASRVVEHLMSVHVTCTSQTPSSKNDNVHRMIINSLGTISENIVLLSAVYFLFFLWPRYGRGGA